VADQFMLVLGPILIVLACGIIVGLSYVYFRVVLPMLAGTNWVTNGVEWREYWMERGHEVSNIENAQKITTLQSTLLAVSTPAGVSHTVLVLFFLINILYNYYKCVVTSNVGKSYALVVRDLAEATGFDYPETEEEMTECKQKLDRSIFNKLEKRKREIMAAYGSGASNTNAAAATSNGNSNNVDIESQQTNSTNGANGKPNNKPLRIPKIHNWQLLSPTEWSWCRYSKQPKPPRSHYDHVTKSLVLNMDHYCPWMFNVVGYFNYRYFFNFLWFVTIALFYGMGICYPAFRNLNSRQYKEQIRAAAGEAMSKTLAVKHLKSNPYIPTPEEKTPVAFGFMMCLAVGLAVLCLSSFHAYLVISAQSTIEFHGNVGKRLKGGWKNPYSAESWAKNWQMVYGARAHGFIGVILSILPSPREPEYLPIPLDGKLVRRKNRVDGANKKEDIEQGTTSNDVLSRKSLDESDRSTDSREVPGLKERAVKHSPQSKEFVI
jgi:palmitoyltransferase